MTTSQVRGFLAASAGTPFSGRLVVTTTDDWDEDIEDLVGAEDAAVRRVGLSALLASTTDWTKLAPDALAAGPTS